MSNIPADLAALPDGINPAAVRVIRARAERIALVAEGMLPTTKELLSGYPFCEGSIERDIRAWTKQRILLAGDSGVYLAALENLAVSPNVESCRLLLEADEFALGNEADRVTLYAACLGDHEAAYKLRNKLRDMSVNASSHTIDGVFQRMMAEGLAGMISNPDEAFGRGRTRLKHLTQTADVYFAAEKWFDNSEQPDPEQTARDAKIAAIINDDRAETAGAVVGGMVVVPKLGHGTTSHKRDLHRAWAGVDGSTILLVARGNVAEQRDGLVHRWPHAADVIDTIMSDLATMETVRFKPTILVGRPGSGKTTLVRAIAEWCSLPCEIIALGGVMDSSLMGTSAQWSTARESIPLQLIRKSKVANPAIVWDEIEKASQSSHNGSPLDALLPMLDRNQSRSIYDLALEVEVDLSAVSHFATCNSLSGIPAPLRDRMRILHMPDPDWRHIGDLATNIVTDLMMSRGLDGRWVAPLAPDEMDVIKRAWSGGSLRQLTRIVETLVDGREQLWGRA